MTSASWSGLMTLGGVALGIEAVTVTSIGWISSVTGCPPWIKGKMSHDYWNTHKYDHTCWTDFLFIQNGWQFNTFLHRRLCLLTKPTSLSFSCALTCVIWFSVWWNDCINSWFCTNKLCKRLGPSSPVKKKRNIFLIHDHKQKRIALIYCLS